MDPQAALTLILARLADMADATDPAAAADARDDAVDALRGLADWLARDGFAPEIANPNGGDHWVVPS